MKILIILLIYLNSINCEKPNILEIDWSDPSSFPKFNDPKDPVPDGSAVFDKSDLEYMAPIFIPLPKVIGDEEIKKNLTLTDDARVGGFPVASDWREIVLITYNGNLGGPGAVINSKWVLCSTRIAPNGVAASSLIVFTNVKYSAATGYTGDSRHRIKEIKINPLKFDYYSTMMLLRVCPATLPKFAVLPPPDKTYSIGQMADFFNFVPSLTYVYKAFTETCECDNVFGWDPVRTLCLKESSTAYNGPTELGSLLFVQGVFAGINLYNFNKGGEPYTYIAKYRDWISQTAV